MNYKHITKYFPSNKHFYLTKEGLDGLKAKLDRLRDERLAIFDQLSKLADKDRAEYILSNDIIKILQINEDDVMKVADILQHADTFEKAENPVDVTVGSTVNLQSGDQTIRYTLVSTIEADPSDNKISEKSPLGRALLGRRLHEIISIITPKGEERLYKVISIG